MFSSTRKGVLYGFGALAAAVILFGSSSVAQAANPVNEHCERYVSYGYFENMGQCMQRLKNGRLAYCKYLKSRGYYDRPNARFKNQGNCVAWYKSQGR